MKRTIVFIDQSLASGGAERVLCTVIRHLDPRKFDIHLIVVSHAGELMHLIPEYVHLHLLDIRHTRQALVRTARLIRVLRPMIVYTTTVRTACLVYCVSLFCRAFISVTRFPTMPESLLGERVASRCNMLLIRRAYRSANNVIAQTEEMASELSGRLGVQPGRIKVINNPVDYEAIDKSLAGAVNPYACGRINLVASGTIYPVKGFDVLIKAFARAVRSEPRLYLNILGRDREGNEACLKSLAEEQGVSLRVEFLGYQKNPYPFYKYADLFILSSRREGMPNVLLECLYLGRPVIATRCAAIVERLIKQGENGFIVDTDNVEQLGDAMLGYRRLKAGVSRRFEDHLTAFLNRLAEA